jgi:hypothetical protein
VMGPVLSDEIESDARGEKGDGKRFLQLILLSRIDAAVQWTTKSLMNRDGTAWVYQGRYGVRQQSWGKMETRTRLRRVHVHVDHSKITQFLSMDQNHGGQSKPG